MAEEAIYGFTQSDAGELLRLLPGAGRVENGPRSRIPVSMMVGQTTSTISQSTPGTGVLYEPTATSVVLGSTPVPLHTIGGNIASGVDVLILPIYGRWYAFEVCG